MKIIDKNGRLFGKISIIDVIVILVVVVMVVAVKVKSNTFVESDSGEYETITYQVKLHAHPDFMVDALKVGDPVYDDNSSTNGNLGRIVDIQIFDGTQMATLEDGTLKRVPTAENKDLIVTVKGEGTVDGDNIMLNNVFSLGINSARNFCTPYTLFSGTVVDIQK